MWRIALDKQVHIYSVDTSSFYNDKEMKIHKRLNRNYRFRSILKKLQKSKSEQRKEKIKNLITSVNKRIKKNKEKLQLEFTSSNPIRSLRSESITDRNIISIFESALTRTLNITTDTLSLDLFIVQVYFFEILRDISLNGFYYNNEKYVIFTASAGQLRVKKVVCIKESLLNQYQDTLMCGLSTEMINNAGGVNINKLLAYKALFSSSTDDWLNFDIDRAIVVEDMELPVKTEVDYIDNKTYEITRKIMDVPITHTDGAGMILPSLSKKNFMFRMPWFKGILTPFDYISFIENESKGKGTVKDIWGKEWHIINDNIQIIFTRSQFKMHKYYSDWNDYKEKFKKFNCQAGVCNVEDDFIKDSRLNYQMIQSLTHVSDEEINLLTKDTIREIREISTNRNTMLDVLGVSKKENKKRSFNQAIELYPELLNDSYTKTILKDIKKSLVKEAKSSKIKISGKYLFLIPDMYAFCEWLFKGEETPTGLLNNGEVFCRIYKKSEKLNVLRSPHLFREHGIRKNRYDDLRSKWFITNGIYTSIRDPISKLLQFDNDGDKSLVIKDELFISIAERHMEEDCIVPLYYEMATGHPEQITLENTYDSLISAYKGSNIGEYSNSITKIWNSKDVSMDVIKWLCMENNYKIDFAKTKIMPNRPELIHKEIQKHTRYKVPYFFIFAKNKEKKNVEKANLSTVNKISSSIPSPRLTFKKMGKFDYRMLMSGENKNVDLNKKIIDAYSELESRGHFMMNSEEEKYSNAVYHYKSIRDKILSVGIDVNYTVDVLTEYLYKYKNTPFKTTLWMCFGNEIVENLKRNVISSFGKNSSNCEECNSRVEVTSNRRKYCDDCWKEKEKEIKREWKRGYDKEKSRSLETPETIGIIE